MTCWCWASTSSASGDAVSSFDLAVVPLLSVSRSGVLEAVAHAPLPQAEAFTVVASNCDKCLKRCMRRADRAIDPGLLAKVFYLYEVRSTLGGHSCFLTCNAVMYACGRWLNDRGCVH